MKQRVLVVGDVMLDRYWHGGVTRISPEAPVPVVKFDRIENRLGGAANVAANVVALGGRATLIAPIGCDEAGAAIEHLCRDAQIAICPSDGQQTTVKTRVIGAGQQMLRMDQDYLPGDWQLDDMMVQFRTSVQDCDVVVLSDYSKGSLRDGQEMIKIARQAGKIVLVDPKGTDWDKYRGATLIKPNASEIRAVGIWPLTETSVNALRLSLGLEAVLVTHGEHGMALYWDGDQVNLPTAAREVFDVTGAGDTVIAAMAVSRSGNWLDDMRFANTAAGIVVGRTGTAVATLSEVLNA